MTRNQKAAVTVAVLAVGALLVIGVSNRYTPQQQPRTTDAMRVTYLATIHAVVPSAKPFDEVVAALEANTPRADFADFGSEGAPGTPAAEVKQKLDALANKDALLLLGRSEVGERQALLGKAVRARSYLIGNPLLAARLIDHDPAVALYLPLRLLVYEDAHGKTHLTFDKLASQLAAFRNERLVTLARLLDEKMEDLVMKAAK